MAKDWLMVTNASTASIYEVEARQRIRLIQELRHPESRMKLSELMTDKIEQHRNPAGRAAYAFTQQSDPKQQEMERFAKHIAGIIAEAQSANQYQRFIIVSPPHFQGLLNKQLPEQNKAKLSLVLTKDYTQIEPQQLLTQLYPKLEAININ
jgi:protein required for attachment to host cells